MKTTKQVKKPRNVLLIVLASVVSIFGLVIAGVGVMLVPDLGWMAALTIVGGLSTTSLAVTAIATNEPSWLLLDLILPG